MEDVELTDAQEEECNYLAFEAYEKQLKEIKRRLLMDKLEDFNQALSAIRRNGKTNKKRFDQVFNSTEMSFLTQFGSLNALIESNPAQHR